MGPRMAYARASRYAARNVITLLVDQVAFRQSMHVGELATLLADQVQQSQSVF